MTLDPGPSAITLPVAKDQWLHVIPRPRTIELWFSPERGFPSVAILTIDDVASLESALARAKAHLARNNRVLALDPGVY